MNRRESRDNVATVESTVDMCNVLHSIQFGFVCLGVGVGVDAGVRE